MEGDATVDDGFTAADVIGVLTSTTNGLGNSKARVNRPTLHHQRPPVSGPPVIATLHAVPGPADLFHLATSTWLVVIRRRATGLYGEPLDMQDKCRLPRAPSGHGIESHRQER
jgi:hypothetical protein